MIIANNVNQMKDRNGLILKYGDKVFLKCWMSNMYLFTVVGFTNNYVACICGEHVIYRKPTNVVKVTNSETWKKNI